MGSRKTHEGVEKVYAAAEAWVDRGLRDDDSLFTPGRLIWTRKWLEQLRERFLDQPDESRDSFLVKLERQLAGSPPEVYQLMAEVLFVHFLIVWTRSSYNERQRIETILGWSTEPVDIPEDLVTGLTPGIANPGVWFHTSRPFQVGFLIEFAEQWKGLGEEQQRQQLDDPWEFKSYVAQIELKGKLFEDNKVEYFPQKEALLHLVHPDTFEGTVSVDQKEQIAKAAGFQRFLTEPSDDVDRKLQQIRVGLEAERNGKDFDYYYDSIQRIWDPTMNPWDDFVRLAKAYMDSGRLESEELDYKLEMGRKLAVARQAILSSSEDWGVKVKSGISGSNLIFSVEHAKFRDWIDGAPNDALQAMQVIWSEDNKSIGERLRGFSPLLPTETSRGTGVRTNLMSVLLMGLDAKECPPFRVGVFKDAYERTTYEKPGSDSDEAVLYNHALAFLDRLTEEAKKRGLTIDNRLVAQSLVWGVLQERADPPPPPPRPYPLEALAEEVYLPVSFLEEIETLLNEKKQVIFQGPPGTGKTFVAQKLAVCLAGSEERVRLVQFHPSYAYEDFVQGYRPTLKNGQAGFELRDGPLLRMAKLADDSPDDVKHFLIIDEINRGNLAKILGELYFLLEYRDQPAKLQYSDKEFRLPKNLYIIGTMNTADRSIALVDLALRRRFYFVEFHPDNDPVKSVLRLWLQTNRPEMEWVADVVEKVNEELKDDRHAAIGPSYFMLKNSDKLDEAAVERIWRHSVLPYIEERRFGGDEVGEEFSLDKLRVETDKGGAIESVEDTNGEKQEAAE